MSRILTTFFAGAVCAGLAFTQGQAAKTTAASFPVGTMEQAELLAVQSRISGVTVYTQGAVVTRSVRLMSADGSFLIEGLPLATDLSSLRLRGMGCEVVSMETRRRTGRELDADELDALNAAVVEARRDVERVSDAHDVALHLVEFHEDLEDRVQALMRKDLASGSGSPATWFKRTEFVKNELREARVEELMAREALTQAKEALALAEGDLKNGGRTNLPDTYDVIVDLVDLPTKDIPRLELDYFVGAASWAPEYDLRAASDLGALELVYNARVRQTTGEDWVDVPLTLSTAKPNRGAKGPDPRMAWVDLFDPNVAVAMDAAPSSAARVEASGDWFLGAGEAAPAEKAWAPSYANVDTSGLAVRFGLPRAETVPSNVQGQVFSVGRATTSLTAEHIAVPSLSDKVWMRGTGTNDTPWNLLPGPAKVFVGGDFVGDAHIAGSVAVGDEFELPLGVDQRLSIERTQLADTSGDRGTFKSKSVQERRWSLALANFGGATTRPDGSVRVIVQEVLPKSGDEDIDVRLGSVTPALSTAERFQTEREEQGILTWVLDVPANGKAEIRWGYEVRWPEGASLIGL